MLFFKPIIPGLMLGGVGAALCSAFPTNDDTTDLDVRKSGRSESGSRWVGPLLFSYRRFLIVYSWPSSPTSSTLLVERVAWSGSLPGAYSLLTGSNRITQVTNQFNNLVVALQYYTISSTTTATPRRLDTGYAEISGTDGLPYLVRIALTPIRYEEDITTWEGLLTQGPGFPSTTEVNTAVQNMARDALTQAPTLATYDISVWVPNGLSGSYLVVAQVSIMIKPVRGPR